MSESCPHCGKRRRSTAQYQGEQRLRVSYEPPHVDDENRAVEFDARDALLSPAGGNITVEFFDRYGGLGDSLDMPMSVAIQLREALDLLINDESVNLSSVKPRASGREIERHIRRALDPWR